MQDQAVRGTYRIQFLVSSFHQNPHSGANQNPRPIHGVEWEAVSHWYNGGLHKFRGGVYIGWRRNYGGMKISRLKSLISAISNSKLEIGFSSDKTNTLIYPIVPQTAPDPCLTDMIFTLINFSEINFVRYIEHPTRGASGNVRGTSVHVRAVRGTHGLMCVRCVRVWCGCGSCACLCAWCVQYTWVPVRSANT